MNAEQVARLLGVSAKTVHRHIARGTITATYIHKQELSIPDDQVEKLRLVLAKSRESRQMSDTSLSESDASQALSRQLEELTERVVGQEQRIASLERQIESLQSIAQDAKNRPVSLPMGETTRIPAKGQENASTEAGNSIPTELPDGTLSVRDFAEKIGMDYTVLDGYTRRGIRGEKMDITEVPHPTRAGYSHKYLTPAQQETALEILKRHGKLQ
jgi:DNA-binding transcriptional MerR regulator